MFTRPSQLTSQVSFSDILKKNHSSRSTIRLAFDREVLLNYQGLLNQDYGDAPDSNSSTASGDYQTQASDGGASHDIVSGIQIGANIDSDDGTAQNTSATADDNSSAVDDEDGVTFGSNLQADDTTYSLNVNLTNNLNQSATLVGWIDFDRNGSFEADEAVSKTIGANSGTSDVVLTWDNDASNNGDGNGDLPGTGGLTGDVIETGTTYARFRLSTDSALNAIDNTDSVGNLIDGEVEDYQFNIGSAEATSTIATPNNVFIGDREVELTLTFDNTGQIPGYGPFALLYLDKTGVDGDDGLTFTGAKYLGSNVVQTEYIFDASGEATIMVGNEEVVVTAPPDFEAGDSLVYLELPFGSFVPDQPQADIQVTVDVSQDADLDKPLNILSQGGYKFGEDALDNVSTDPIILEDIAAKTNDAIAPQLVTLTKNYLGPEDETATGPNYVRQYELVVSIADGQTIDNLDITEVLPDTLQFVDLVSIKDVNGNDIDPSRITNVATPDDGGLESIDLDAVGTENDAGSDNTPTPGGTLTRRIDTVTGTGGDDIVLTLSYFVPRLDASGSEILDPTSGDDFISEPQAQLGDGVTGDGNNIWTPTDLDDSIAEVEVHPINNDLNPLPQDPDHQLEDQSIAIQKSVANADLADTDYSPGDILEYTLDFQISDYFAFEDIIITDTFSDGQRFNTSFVPKITTVSEHGTTTTSNLDFTFNNYTPSGISDSGNGETLIIDETDIDNTQDGSGNTKLTFNVSDELIAGGLDGQLIGGGVPQGGFQDLAELKNNPPLPNGATTGQITFQTVIQEEYSDAYLSGDASIDANDRLDNDAIIDGAVLNVLDPNNTNDPGTPDALAATGQREDDDTNASLNITAGNLYKSIYAVNGVVDPNAKIDDNLNDGIAGYDGVPEIAPGDTITYRLTYQLPISDVEQLQLTDYFPLPVFDIGTEFASPTFNTTFDASGTAVPAAGESHYGRLDTFHSLTGAPIPNLSTNAAGNSLNYFYGNFDDPGNNASVVDLLVTVTADNDPFADNLLLTNQVNQSQQNTFEEVSTQDAIVQIKLREPALEITKGVVAYNSFKTGLAYDPTTAHPSEVTFASTSEPVFTGTVSSSDLDSAPIDSNLTGALEAGDIVTFAVVVENTGGSRKGAFDVVIQDVLPDGFEIPTTGLNLHVKDGTGANLNYTRLGSGGDSDLFGNGIELEDPGNTSPSGSGLTAQSDAAALDGFSDTSGTNLAIISYDLAVTNASTYIDTATIENQARVVSYANTEGAESFPSIDDSAIVEVDKPQGTKEIVATSETHTLETGDGSNNSNAREVTIGEIVRYRLIAEIPTGSATDFILKDDLPNGQTFLNDGTSQVAFVTNSGVITSSAFTPPPLELINLGNSPADAVTFANLEDEEISSDPTINDDTYNTGTDVYFKLGDIINTDRDADREYIVVEFNALVDNNNDSATKTNEAGEFPSNDFEIIADGTTLDISDKVKLEIVEPQVQIDKKIKASTSSTFEDSISGLDAGDIVNYSLTFTNPADVDNTGSVSDAYEIEIADTLPAFLDLQSIDSVSSDDGAGGTLNLVDTSDLANNQISFTADGLPQNGSITIEYTAQIVSGVSPNFSIENQADIKYTSLEGTGADNTNPTGSSIEYVAPDPIAGGGSGYPSGDPLGERNGVDTGGTANDYNTNDVAPITTSPLEPVKSIVATSETDTGTTAGASNTDEDLTIGEIARYRLVVQIPEGDTNNLEITDLLPPGLRYLNDGTTKVAFVSDGNLSSDTITDAQPGTAPDLASTNSSVTPDFDLPSGAIVEENPDGGFVAGEDPTFQLGNITNDDSDGNGEFVVIEFNAVVENVAANQDPGTLDNQFNVTATNTDVDSAPVSIDLVEPSIDTIDKQADVARADAGNAVNFTVTYTNDGNSNAYEVRLLDTPASTELVNIRNVNVSSDGTLSSLTSASDSTKVDETLASVAPGETITVTYTADLETTLNPGDVADNTVDVTYSSLPGSGTSSNPTGSTPPDEERDSTDGVGGALNDYAAQGGDSVTINTYSIGSTIFRDIDNDGVLETGDGESGIPGVVVQLYNDSGTEILVGADGILGTVDDGAGGITTDVNGNYFFTGLTPGNYQIKIPDSNFATSAGLETTPLSSQTTETTDNRADGDDNGIQTGGIRTEIVSPVINLSAGEEPTTTEAVPGKDLDSGADDANGDMTVDFGFVPVYQISGTVLDDTNNPELNAIDNPGDTPIPGVTVELFADDGFGEPTGSAIATEVTDGSGFYQFTDLLAGDYVVVETQPSEYDSVTDADGNEQNKILVSITNSDITNRDFLESENLTPTVDLNGTAAGEDHTTVYDQNSGGVAIADPATTVTDDLDNIISATIDITNAQAGDILNVIGSLPGSIAIDTVNSTDTTLILTGVGTAAEYQAAIAAIEFNNTEPLPNRSDRTIAVTLDDGTNTTSPVTTTVLWDTDGDTVPDNDDIDDDNDGILDTVEDAAADADADGIINSLDIDSDDDGIPDNIEAQTTDGYIASSESPASTGFIDTNGDGLDDNYDNTTAAGITSGATGVGLNPFNADDPADSIPDYLDSDADNDGVLDLNEADHSSTTLGTDSDRDGLNDTFENGTINDGFDVNDAIDAPLNGILPDADLDAALNNPVISDLDYRDKLFHPIVDLNGTESGQDYSTTHTPSLGGTAIANNTTITDLDSSNLASGTITLTNYQTGDGFLINGIAVSPGNMGTIPGTTIGYNIVDNGTDIIINLNSAASKAEYEAAIATITFNNSELNPNRSDRNITVEVVDNDTNISNIATTTIQWDTDADGVVDSDDIDDDNDGIIDIIEDAQPDGDADGIINSLDVDADNDGIPDNIEAQTTSDYIAPSGIAASIIDTNNDGLDDNYDAGVILDGNHTGVGLTPIDVDSVLSDADGIADYLDTDADNDGILDLNEAGHSSTTLGTDNDRDGLNDTFENGTVNDGFDVNDAIDSPLNGILPDDDGDAITGIPLTADLDYRDTAAPTLDLDGDDPLLGNDFATTYVVGGSPISVSDDVLIADLDDLNLQNATIHLKTRPDGDAAESLIVNGALPGGITTTGFDYVTGILKLTGDATIAEYQTAIAQIQYSNSIGLKTDDRLIDVVVNDGISNSNLATTTIAIDAPPFIDLDGDDHSFI